MVVILFVLVADILQKMLIQNVVASRFRTGDPDVVHVLTRKSLYFFGATLKKIHLFTLTNLDIQNESINL